MGGAGGSAAAAVPPPPRTCRGCGARAGPPPCSTRPGAPVRPAVTASHESRRHSKSRNASRQYTPSARTGCPAGPTGPIKNPLPSASSRQPASENGHALPLSSCVAPRSFGEVNLLYTLATPPISPPRGPSAAVRPMSTLHESLKKTHFQSRRAAWYKEEQQGCRCVGAKVHPVESNGGRVLSQCISVSSFTANPLSRPHISSGEAARQ